MNSARCVTSCDDGCSCWFTYTTMRRPTGIVSGPLPSWITCPLIVSEPSHESPFAAPPHSLFRTTPAWLCTPVAVRNSPGAMIWTRPASVCASVEATTPKSVKLDELTTACTCAFTPLSGGMPGTSVTFRSANETLSKTHGLNCGFACATVIGFGAFRPATRDVHPPTTDGDAPALDDTPTNTPATVTTASSGTVIERTRPRALCLAVMGPPKKTRLSYPRRCGT